jgi:ABC-type amino acid transport substrate-binding protein
MKRVNYHLTEVEIGRPQSFSDETGLTVAEIIRRPPEPPKAKGRYLMIKNKGMCQKGLVCIFFLLAMFFLVSPSAASDLLTNEQKDWLSRHKEVQVGAFNDYPPFGFVDATGQAQGMSVDFWNLMASRLGFKAQFHPTAFALQLEGLKTGLFDSLAGIFPLDERRKFFGFTKEYTIIATYIYVVPKYAGLKGLMDLKGLKVAGVEADSGKVIAEKAGLKPKGFTSYLSTVQALGRGEIDAIIMDELVVNYYAVQNKLENRIKRIGQPVDQGKMTLPVAKENTMLLGILQKGVSLVSSDEWLKIRQKWVGK